MYKIGLTYSYPRREWSFKNKTKTKKIKTNILVYVVKQLKIKVLRNT